MRKVLWILVFLLFLPTHVSCDPLAYLAHRKTGGGGFVSVLDLSTGQIIKTIDVGPNNPQDIDLTPDRKRAYVTTANYEEDIKIIDLFLQVVVDEVDVPAGDHSALNHQGTLLLNSGSGYGAPVVGVPSNAWVETIELPPSINGIAFSPDGKFAYLVRDRVSDGTDGPDLLYIVDVASGQVTAEVSLGEGLPREIVVHPDGSKAYVANQPGLQVIDTATAEVVDVIDVDTYGAYALAISPDGGRVYLTAINYWDDDFLAVVNTETNQLVEKIPVGKVPLDVAVSPDGSKVYAVSMDDRTVTVVDASSNQVVDTIDVDVPGIDREHPAAIAISWGPAVPSYDVVIDTDNLEINGDPQYFDGVEFMTHVEDGIARFIFKGDFNISSGIVWGWGARPASLHALNNMNIGSQVFFDFGSTRRRGNLGGGSGGTKGAGGEKGLAGRGGSGGSGGFGGQICTSLFGGSGNKGGYGWIGKEGGPGLPGIGGQDGVNAPGSGGPGGAEISEDPIAPECFDPPIISRVYPEYCYGGEGGTGDSGWAFLSDGGSGKSGKNATGVAKKGSSGSQGIHGSNTGHGLLISGGGGGGGGGGGTGGQGAYGGGGGGGGGGGSGTGIIIGVKGLSYEVIGGEGAKGEQGEEQYGGKGGEGGHGGAGGGAFMIAANGLLKVKGILDVRGGNGDPGRTGQVFNKPVSDGEVPVTLWNQPPQQCVSVGLACVELSACFDNHNGFYGGAGGHGGGAGKAGNGGIGGPGGGGGGGTVKLWGSVVEAEQAAVHAAGGHGVSNGANGRFLFGSNTDAGYPAEIQGAKQEYFEGQAGPNPFLSPATSTPYIPNLVGGAETFGLMGAAPSMSEYFDEFLAGARAWASAAILRLDTGPEGYDYDFIGHDYVLLMNLCDEELVNPKLGIDLHNVGGAYLQDLLVGGYMTSPVFGGNGPQLKSSLDPHDVYATLFPEQDALFSAVVDQESLLDVSLENGEAAFLVIDDDGDGIAQCHDLCPASDLAPTVIIAGCDSKVTNAILIGGCSVSDKIDACADSAINHGEFVACVSQLTNGLKKDGILRSKDHGAIQRCAAQAFN